ncbi:MAG TPA: response regulator [Candidatus Acidoferrales bacterium]|jgi:CheY-like chemotaxis protein|nr:response regulator [Candidatus Acidoferrales bacterium]
MSRAKIHILLVEDNHDHAELLRRDLEHFPLPTHLYHVEDGEAAVEYVFGRGPFSNRAEFPLPDVILLDLRLPRLDGMEVLKLVKNDPATGRVPVIVLTTSDAERDVTAALAGKADKFLTKPADSQTLLQTLLDLGLRSPPGEPAEPQPAATETAHA